MAGSAPRSQGTSGPADRAERRELSSIGAAVDAARSDPAGGSDSARFLTALLALRQVRELLADWEPELIDAARASGASWAQLAPVLGVASRQAAERRALRLRPDAGGAATTGEARVAAERGRRAQARAVDAWARTRAADLRVLGARVGALADLPEAADGSLAAVRAALGGADAAALLQPLIDARAHFGAGHPNLAEQIDALSGAAETARADVRAQRGR